MASEVQERSESPALARREERLLDELAMSRDEEESSYLLTLIADVQAAQEAK